MMEKEMLSLNHKKTEMLSLKEKKFYTIKEPM